MTRLPASSKFKRRKNTAQKKLEDEKQNILRINDILAELEKQLGPLENQSETARQYLKKKETLKIYDVNMFLLETDRLQNSCLSCYGRRKPRRRI